MVYTQKKIQQDSGHPWGYYILRPIALKIAPLLTKLSANAISWMGFATGLVGCAGLGLGWYWTSILGALLLNVSLLIDHIDGTVARIKKTESLYGEWLDGTVGYIQKILTPVAVGVGLFVGLEGYLGLNKEWYLVLGLSYALVKALRLVISSYHKSVFGETLFSRLKPNSLGTWILSVEVPILLICAIFHLLDIYLVLYYAIMIAVIGVIFWRTLIKQE